MKSDTHVTRLEATQKARTFQNYENNQQDATI